MDLSLIQKDILITLISLYHQYSHPIKGEEIAEIIRRNPGTVRNQMQTLKVLGLTDGVPGPKGGYHPTARAYSELNLSSESTNIDVPISRNGTICEGIRVNEIAFTTLTHADLCHALIKIIGNVHAFEIGDNITIGPTPVNKLLIKGEIFGKDEVSSSLLISTTEMTSLPKKPIHEYMTTPLISLESDMTLAYAATTLLQKNIHCAPVLENGTLVGILSMRELITAFCNNLEHDTPISTIMKKEVHTVQDDKKLYEIIRIFKEEKIDQIIVIHENIPVGILTHLDIIRLFPSL